MTIILTKAPAITPDMAGCWFAGASNRTADELSAAVILCAHYYGMTVDSDLYALASEIEGWCEDPNDGEWLSDAALSAESYLNDRAPEGFIFTFDDGFYLYAMEGDDEL